MKSPFINKALVPIGADGTVLMADSTTAEGYKWVNPVSGSYLPINGGVLSGWVTINSANPSLQLKRAGAGHGYINFLDSDDTHKASIAYDFNSDQPRFMNSTGAWNDIWHKGTLNMANYLRSNASDNFSGGILTVYNDAGQAITAPAGVNGLQVYQPTAGADAIMTFHVGGDYAVHFGLDGGVNDLCVGGWSMGAQNYKIWHQGNDGSGSGLDADKLDGYHATQIYNNAVTHCVRRGTVNLNDSSWTQVNFSSAMPGIPTVVLTVNTSNSGSIVGKVRNVTATGFQGVIGGSGAASDFNYIAIWE